MKSVNKTIKLCLAAFILTACCAVASAQEMGEVQGYANVFIRVQVVSPSASDNQQVWISANNSGLQTWKTTVDFKATLPVYMESVFFFGTARDKSNTYEFGGWYVDDGDGVFDIEKDLFFSDTKEAAYLYFPVEELTGSSEYYETETDAKNATDKPTEPQALIWAYFSNSASVYHDSELFMPIMGEVTIDKRVNVPGDEVTITATPYPGYQFEYWKSEKGSTLGSDDKHIVSYDNPYTFTVQGSEKLYAYFSQIDAPVINFPAEGGWKAFAADKVWWIHEQSDGMAYTFSLENLEKQADGIFVNLDGAEEFNTQRFSENFVGRTANATLMYGRGPVRFAYSTLDGKSIAGYLLYWSGSKGYTIQDKDHAYNYHVYRFYDNMEGFFEIGSTDEFAYDDPSDVPSSVSVPAECAFLKLSPYDLSDLGLINDDGSIPSIIALSEKAFEPFVENPTGIEKPVVREHNLGGMKVYTLSGMQVRATNQPGIFIVNGKKVVNVGNQNQ